jgi:histidyl-tRNA synthetase
MKTTIPTVKGTRDFYPDDMYARTWLYNTIRRVSEAYGYLEYEAPILEKIELYAAKSGEELVNKQSFVFPDRSGEKITLRPELTPSLARMVAQRQNELVFPLRWWSYGPFWRYERPQRGRTREFFQWNIDMIGADTPEADAELVAISASFFQETGLKPGEVIILVNNRRLMEAEIAALGISKEKQTEVFHLIDRRDKLSPEDWHVYALENGLNQDQIEQLVNVLTDDQLWKRSPELVRFFAAIEVMGVKDYVRFDAGTIRGLDYYTGTVFEAKEANVGGRSIFGGGRYDNLVSDVGGDPVSAVGFAMGDVMISIILRERGYLPEKAIAPARVLVTVFDEGSLLDSFALASELRQAGIKASVYPEPAKLPKQLKYADKMGMRWAIIVGTDEIARNEVTIKDLTDRTQVSVSRTELVNRLHQMQTDASLANQAAS